MDWISAITAGSVATAIASTVKHISNGWAKYAAAKAVCRRDVDIKLIECVSEQRVTSDSSIGSVNNTKHVPVDSTRLINLEAILDDKPRDLRLLLGGMHGEPKVLEDSSCQPSTQTNCS